MLEEALEHLVKGIVDHPDDVRVNSHGLRRGRVLEVRVHPDDLGKVIGRGGRTARALRTVSGKTMFLCLSRDSSMNLSRSRCSSISY